MLFSLPAEIAHELGIEALRAGLVPRGPNVHFAEIERFGLKFRNPLGIAAGFDKNGVVVDQLARLGFGFVEVGTVTLKPQRGNPKPRMFRLPQDQGLINRLGFNNDGAAVVVERLKNLKRNCIVGLNIGRNKDVSNEGAIENYAEVFEAVWPVADYITINVSSPNTLGLRELQKDQYLFELLSVLQQRNSAQSAVRVSLDSEDSSAETSSFQGKPLLVKLAPDLDPAELEIIVDTCVRCQIDGIVATNTTISREGLKTPNVAGIGNGGLSGKPLGKRSTEIISLIYKYSKGKLPIIGVGGIFDAADAFEKIAAGASLLQAYTGFVYGGPSFAGDVNAGLAEILHERGFASLDDAVGSAVK